ncbi:1-deoxy-D-xylulose-5-phosphate synthase [Ureaplasma ceti]|uniref:1-deoxy-D-xylulose-5-phosphate synthase n=1 Tax=Ureaplasma ceti TaxID=3119530 RepID=A0ABP9UB36_9BACT
MEPIDTINILKGYQGVADLKNLSFQELRQLAQEVRSYLITLSQTKEIHLSSNLGIVEITLAILLNFNLLHDVVIYDTGHQSYVHKMLTDRKDRIATIRSDNGLSGLLDMFESPYDHYSPGHSSNSISVLDGMYQAIADVNKNPDGIYQNDKYHVAIIGDAALTNGVAFEALNDLGTSQDPLIILLNDNGMSISKAVGQFAKNINQLQTDAVNKNIFTELNLQYLGPIDGNDLTVVDEYLKQAKQLAAKGPVLLHCRTNKGKGLSPAEQDWIGNYHSNSLKAKPSFGTIAYQNLNQKIKEDTKLRILNPAMNLGSGFNQMLLDKLPHYQDTGINEEHTVSKASGMALKGLKVYNLFYSTFLQRSYDQLVHDVARFNLNMTFLLDRADLSGGDGPSHHGIFDVNYLKSMPNVTITSPRNFVQLDQLINLSYENEKGMFAIRYPKSPFVNIDVNSSYIIKPGSWETVLSQGYKTVVLTYGPYTDAIYEYLQAQNLPADLVCATYLHNYDQNYLAELCNKYDNIVCYERIYGDGGLVADVYKYIAQHQLTKKVYSFHYKDFVGHGSTSQLDKNQGMDLHSLGELIQSI